MIATLATSQNPLKKTQPLLWMDDRSIANSPISQNCQKRKKREKKGPLYPPSPSPFWRAFGWSFLLLCAQENRHTFAQVLLALKRLVSLESKGNRNWVSFVCVCVCTIYSKEIWLIKNSANEQIWKHQTDATFLGFLLFFWQTKVQCKNQGCMHSAPRRKTHGFVIPFWQLGIGSTEIYV